ncbi:hypothetical protein BDB00DRAFT_850742 [Zychaea mexicana]|uniref:uncharacterized protein n=1 Tax=Zychaea mexicana TaxID=64656 RepID=UPI0022FE31BA|nr:uncharacterized protein BDB00DRAFT_850742 [Zychaea mexicana]KAI9487949.1 hypothetical protein BDB00DRAFT_850742 [Zychaea mexicana]
MQNVNLNNPNPRILKDIFHLMDMIKVSKRHGLAKDFARRLRDAIFIVNQQDRDYRLRHNINVGMANRYGRVHKSHYSPWITQTICRLQSELNIPDKAGAANALVVKDALYMRMSDETFGIAGFPSDVASILNIDKVDHQAVALNNIAARKDPLLPQKLSTQLIFPDGSTSKKKDDCILSLLHGSAQSML